MLASILRRLTREMIRQAASAYRRSGPPDPNELPSRSYMVRIDGRNYPVRSIIIIAARDGLGETVTRADLASGKTTCCMTRLEALGFEKVSVN